MKRENGGKDNGQYETSGKQDSYSSQWNKCLNTSKNIRVGGRDNNKGGERESSPQDLNGWIIKALVRTYYLKNIKVSSGRRHSKPLHIGVNIQQDSS